MKKTFSLIFLSIIVSACDGGGGGSNNNQNGGGNTLPPPQPPAENPNGIWEGTFSENNVGTSQMLAVLYAGNIFAVSVGANTVFTGTYSISGDDLSGQVTEYSINGGVVGTAALAGVFEEQSQISLTYDASDGGTGSISLFYDDLYERDSSLATIAGNYSFRVQQSGYRLDIAIQGNGNLSGSDSEGCQLSGNVAILDPNINLYAATLTLSSCGLDNGIYSGFAGLGDAAAINDVLTFTVSNQQFVYIAQLVRQ